MPLTSGLQFLRAIRAIPNLTNTPVAIVTGDYYLDDAQSNERERERDPPPPPPPPPPPD